MGFPGSEDISRKPFFSAAVPTEMSEKTRSWLEVSGSRDVITSGMSRILVLCEIHTIQVQINLKTQPKSSNLLTLFD